jgi:hypothetical protein
MRKRFLTALGAIVALVFSVAHCSSHCKKYAEKFCQGQGAEGSPACLQAKEKMKDWSSDKCRMELNEVLLDEQTKNLENELK